MWNWALALAISKSLGFAGKFPTHLAMAGASAPTAVVEALANGKLCPDWDLVCSGWWWCAITCTRRAPWDTQCCPRHPSCCRADPCHGGTAIYSRQTFGAVSLLRWWKHHCRDAAQRSSSTALFLNPCFPAPSPAVPAQLWVPSLRLTHPQMPGS